MKFVQNFIIQFLSQLLGIIFDIIYSFFAKVIDVDYNLSFPSIVAMTLLTFRPILTLFETDKVGANAA